jgi:CBS domain-containing protein
MNERIRDVMTSEPVVLPADASIEQAARVMKHRAIGDALVADGDKLCGLVTDRDLVVRALAEGRPDACLGDICSHEVVTLGPEETLSDAVQVMSERAIRRMPVVENGSVIGMLSLGDIAVDRDRESALGEISAAPPTV